MMSVLFYRWLQERTTLHACHFFQENSAVFFLIPHSLLPFQIINLELYPGTLA
jgi:hypothetical protein